MSFVVDASVWVSGWLSADVHHIQSRQWLAAHVNAGDILIVPILVLAEVAGPIARRTGNPVLADQAVHQMQRIPTLRLVPIDRPAGQQAARLAAHLRSSGADAIYVSVASELGIPLVTSDDEQRARATPLIAVITPG